MKHLDDNYLSSGKGLQNAKISANERKEAEFEKFKQTWSKDLGAIDVWVRN